MPQTPVVVRRSDPEVMRMWWMSLGLAGVVIGVVAALLAQIIAAARSIDRRAEGIWTVGKQIAGNTASIWMLGKTNEHLARMLGAAQSIDRTAGSIDARLRALADQDGRAG
jgi:hypothetical protein